MKEWRLDVGVRIAVSCHEDGNQKEALNRQCFFKKILPNRSPDDLVVCQQVHGNRIEWANRAKRWTPADGLWTKSPHLVLGVFGADCPGLVLASDQVLCVVHCGWRGIANGIVRSAVEILRFHHRKPLKHLVAFIGPGICGRCYEVDEPVLRTRTWPAKAITASRPGHVFLDLSRTIISDLASVPTQIIQSDLCTAENPNLISRRRDGPGKVMMLMAWRETFPLKPRCRS